MLRIIARVMKMWGRWLSLGFMGFMGFMGLWVCGFVGFSFYPRGESCRFNVWRAFAPRETLRYVSS